MSADLINQPRATLHIRNAAYGVLCNGDSVLMCSGVVFGHRIVNFPGGEFNLGEGQEEALVREFSEEVGINVSVESTLHVSDDKVFISPDIPNTRMINRYFLVTADFSKIDLLRRSTEVESLLWVPISDLPLSDMLEVDRAFVEVLKPILLQDNRGKLTG